MLKKTSFFCAAIVCALNVCLALPAAAQTSQSPAAAPPADADLAKQLTNPIASLVSVPLQFNWDQPLGIDHDTRSTINFQPVVPLELNTDWNLILRWIMPYVSQPRLSDDGLPQAGVSDIVTSLFLSPSRPGKVIWGAGPVFQLPTTSDPVLGSGKWGIGPTAVVLQQAGGWTYGALVNHIWSFAGDDFTGGASRDDVNATFLQPFLAYTTANAVTYTVNMEASANWEADEDNWTAPLHVQIAKLTKFGPFPMSMGAGAGYFTAAPGDNPDWRLRIVFTLLLPRHTP